MSSEVEYKCCSLKLITFMWLNADKQLRAFSLLVSLLSVGHVPAHRRKPSALCSDVRTLAAGKQTAR